MRFIATGAGLFLVLSVATGCAVSERNLTGLEVGMARTDVMRLLGTPDAKSAEGNVEVYRYRLGRGMQFKDDIAEPTHYVRMVDGRVESFGRLDGDGDGGGGPAVSVKVRSD